MPRPLPTTDEEAIERLRLAAIAHAPDAAEASYRMKRLILDWSPGELFKFVLWHSLSVENEPPTERIPMILHCPRCSTQHIDAPDPENGWDNPPHRSHQCHQCGHIWRPCDLYTDGVPAIATKGTHDHTLGPQNPSTEGQNQILATALIRLLVSKNEMTCSEWLPLSNLQSAEARQTYAWEQAEESLRVCGWVVPGEEPDTSGHDDLCCCGDCLAKKE